MKSGSLQRKFYDFVDDNHLLVKCQTVVAAVSGGVDSMSLLDLLMASRERWQVGIVVAHFHHQLRGAEADRDEELVRKFCAEHKIPFFRDTAEVRKIARQRRVSPEMAGRDLRYAFFQKIANNYPGSVIATAHTLDDQAETILLRMLKGSGLQGLSGIAPRRGNIIRPLLFAAKTELYEYARERQLPFAEDHTNALLDCQRNIIRNQLLPGIKNKINPNIATTLANLAQNLGEARQYLAEAARIALDDLIISADSEQIVLDKSGLKTYFIAVEKEIIWQGLQRLAGSVPTLSFKRMNALMNLVNNGKTGRRFVVENAIMALIDRERLILHRNSCADWPEANFFPGQTVTNAYFTLSTEVLDVSHFRRSARRSQTEFIDLDRLDNELILRHWRKGDRITPLGMDKPKKVSDIFIDLKVPLMLKCQIPVLVSGPKIVWLAGLVLADEFKVSATTKMILKLTYEEKLK
jgi:tRNA(Ile)-lysidine synthase